MWYMGSLVAACKLLMPACGIEFSDEELNPGPLNWEHRVSHWMVRKVKRSVLKYCWQIMTENKQGINQTAVESG